MDFPISTPRPMPRRPPVRSLQYMSTATRDHPSGSLRVSDADRDRAIAELSEHYQAGRLTTEELEDRTGRALAARTSADLAALFTDLPRRQAPVTSAASPPTSPVPASPGWYWPARVPVIPVHPRRRGGARPARRSPLPLRVAAGRRDHHHQAPGRRRTPARPPLSS